MKHFAMMLALTLVCASGVAHAQVPAPGTDSGYVEVTAGPTFGHKVGASIGAEGAYWVSGRLGIFAEGGWMTNVVTSSTQADAQLIASAIGGSADPKTKVGYFDAGVTYRFPRGGRMQPYVVVGVGVAHVRNDTKFSVGGTDVTGSIDQLGVQLGTDLGGSYTKPFVTAGGGVHIPFGTRWLGDISYRYGWIARDTSDNGDIAAINTNRIQFGFGTRF